MNSLVNKDNSHLSGIHFSITISPSGPHTMFKPSNNVDSAAGKYSMNGGKINRRRINKISNRYKIKGSKKSIRRHVRKIKSRVRTKYSNRRARSYSARHSMRQKGGAFQLPAVTPSNVYSLGGVLSAGNSALATPPPLRIVANANM